MRCADAARHLLQFACSDREASLSDAWRRAW